MFLSAEVTVRNRSSTITAKNIRAYNIPWDTLLQYPLPPLVCDLVPPGESCQIAFDPSMMTCPTTLVNVAIPIVIQGDNTTPVTSVSIFMTN